MQKGWTTRTLLVLLCMVLLCKVPAYAMETRASDRINLTSVVLSKKVMEISVPIFPFRLLGGCM